MSTDSLTRTAVLRAPLGRVWRALTDHAEFGAWFRAALDGPFVTGGRVTGHITYPGYEHLAFEAWVEAIEPPHRFVLRWHPHAIDPAVDYGAEPTTRVEFVLAEEPAGTRVTITESGFDGVPAARRALAFRMNGDGWTIQLDNLAAHVA